MFILVQWNGYSTRSRGNEVVVINSFSQTQPPCSRPISDVPPSRIEPDGIVVIGIPLAMARRNAVTAREEALPAVAKPSRTVFISASTRWASACPHRNDDISERPDYLRESGLEGLVGRATPIQSRQIILGPQDVTVRGREPGMKPSSVLNGRCDRLILRQRRPIR